jgi:hypothetical protein
MTSGSLRTSAGGRRRSSPELQHHHAVADVHHEPHVVLDQQQRHPRVAQALQILAQRARSPAFRPAAGSSTSSSPGCAASARASSTRRRSPKARSRASTSLRCSRRSSARIARARSAASRPLWREAARRNRSSTNVARSVDERAGDDVFEHGHLGEESRVLKRAADAERGDAVRLPVRDVGPGDEHASRVEAADAADRVEERRLARTVGPDQRGQRAVLERERNVVDRDEPAETFRRAFDDEPRRRLPVFGRARIERGACARLRGASEALFESRARRARAISLGKADGKRSRSGRAGRR